MLAHKLMVASVVTWKSFSFNWNVGGHTHVFQLIALVAYADQDRSMRTSFKEASLIGRFLSVMWQEEMIDTLRFEWVHG